MFLAAPGKRLNAGRALLGVILVGLTFAGCNYRAPVIGREDVLVILVSDEDRPLLEPLLTDVFGRELATPAPEPFFKILWASPAEFETYQRYKSLIIASLAHPADSTGDVLVRKILGRERVADAMAGGNPIFVATDFLADGQMFMGLIALDAIHAQRELFTRKSWIFEQFDHQMGVRQSKVVYRHGEKKSLIREMEGKYGWGLRIQNDYIVVKEKPEENFVWLGRGYPYRWLSVHWVERGDTARISPEWGWRHMEYIADELFADIYVDSLFRSSEAGQENGHNILILRGVWGHKQQVSGGPFFTYVFRDVQQNRIYFITGLVFNPGGLKSLLIRRQEVIARTFHTFSKPPVSVRRMQKENLI